MILLLTNSSKVQKANTGNSLRTTIPLEIVKELEIGIGDLLVWSCDVKKGDKTINIKKVDA